jgi:hypothetical protein
MSDKNKGDNNIMGTATPSIRDAIGPYLTENNMPMSDPFWQVPNHNWRPGWDPAHPYQNEPFPRTTTELPPLDGADVLKKAYKASLRKQERPLLKEIALGISLKEKCFNVKECVKKAHMFLDDLEKALNE